MRKLTIKDFYENREKKMLLPFSSLIKGSREEGGDKINGLA